MNEEYVLGPITRLGVDEPVIVGNGPFHYMPYYYNDGYGNVYTIGGHGLRVAHDANTFRGDAGIRVYDPTKFLELRLLQAKNADIYGTHRFANGVENLVRGLVMAPAITTVAPVVGEGLLAGGRGLLAAGDAAASTLTNAYTTYVPLAARQLINVGASSYFGAEGLTNLASDNGLAKTGRLLSEGDYLGAAKSGAGDVVDALMVTPFVGPATKAVKATTNAVRNAVPALEAPGRLGTAFTLGATAMPAYASSMSGNSLLEGAGIVGGVAALGFGAYKLGKRTKDAAKVAEELATTYKPRYSWNPFRFENLLNWESRTRKNIERAYDTSVIEDFNKALGDPEKMKKIAQIHDIRVGEGVPKVEKILVLKEDWIPNVLNNNVVKVGQDGKLLEVKKGEQVGETWGKVFDANGNPVMTEVTLEVIDPVTGNPVLEYPYVSEEILPYVIRGLEPDVRWGKRDLIYNKILIPPTGRQVFNGYFRDLLKLGGLGGAGYGLYKIYNGVFPSNDSKKDESNNASNNSGNNTVKPDSIKWTSVPIATGTDSSGQLYDKVIVTKTDSTGNVTEEDSVIKLDNLFRDENDPLLMNVNNLSGN